MIELNDEKSFQVLGEPAAHERLGASESLGEVSLAGELVEIGCPLVVEQTESIQQFKPRDARAGIIAPVNDCKDCFRLPTNQSTKHQRSQNAFETMNTMPEIKLPPTAT